MQLKRNKEMEFERLKKNHKKQILIGVLAVCIIGGALTFATTRAKYKLTQDIELAKGTINYKPYDFKVMAMYQQNDSGTYTEITTMPSSGYIINEEKTYCTTDNKIQVKGKIKTISGNTVITNLIKNDKCYLYFDKYIPPITMDNIIAKLGAKTTTPNFTSVATTDEGVYAVSDGMYGGTSYYWRGAATTNHVIFANKCWRIVRINGDKTMRLIYNGAVSNGTCTGNGSNSGSIAVTSQVYNTSNDRTEYVGWTYSTGSQRTTSGTASNAKSQTESWYSSNITGTNANKVADGKFCNDRNTASGYSWSSQPSSPFYYAARERLESAKTPTLSCPSADIYILKVGAITADEMSFAGGVSGTANNSYYLNNGQFYWTMSPYNWYYINSSNRHASMYIVGSDGIFTGYSVSYTTLGLRPVINLKSDVTFSSGDGTQNNPYVVQ